MACFGAEDRRTGLKLFAELKSAGLPTCLLGLHSKPLAAMRIPTANGIGLKRDTLLAPGGIAYSIEIA